MPEQKNTVAKIFNKSNDAYSCYSKLRGVIPDEAELARVLWELFIEDEIDLGADHGYLTYLRNAPDAFDARAFLKLITSLAEHYPKGTRKTKWGSTSCYSESDLPGLPWGFYELLKLKTGDEPFRAAIVELWKEIPEPYDMGTAYALAQAGFLSASDLPEELLETAASVHVRHGKGSYHAWTRPLPWDSKVWGAAIVRAARADGVTFEHAEVLADFIPHTDWPTMIALASKVSFAYDTWNGVKLFDDLPRDELGVLEAAVVSLESTLVPPDHGTPFPAILLLPAYLRACGRFEVTPSKTIDPVVAQFYETYKPTWSGGSFDEYHIEMVDSFRKVPLERLEPIMLQSKEVNWLLISAAPAPAIIDRAVTDLKAKSSLGYGDRPDLAFKAFGAAAIPALTAALGGPPCTLRHYLVGALIETKRPESAPGLVAILSDKVKSNREWVVSALIELGKTETEAVLEAIATALDAKIKDARQGAAEVLSGLPPSQRGYDLAQQRLTKEKAQGVKQLLEAITSPSANGQDDVPDISEELVTTEGAAWKDHVSQMRPNQLMDAYWSYLEKIYFSNYLLNYNPCSNWIDLLKSFRDLEGTTDRAVMTAAAMSRWDGNAYLTEVSRTFVGIGATLASKLVEGSFTRLPGFSKSGYSFSEADAYEWLSQHAREVARPAFISGLSHKTKSIRTTCLGSLIEDGGEVVPQVLPLLNHNRADVRLTAAELLEKVGPPEILDQLQEALRREKSHNIKKVLERAIAAKKNASLDFDCFTPDEAGDRGLDQALASMGMARPPNVTATIPEIHWRSGPTMSPKALDWFLDQLLRESPQRSSESLSRVRSRLNDGDCHASCEALLATTSADDRGWALYIQAVIGSDERIEALGKKLEILASSRQTNWGSDGVEVLVRQGSDIAVRWLDHWARKSRRNALLGRAAGGLTRMAEAKGLSVEDMIDEATPHFGFDGSGLQELDYGPRTIIARLSAEEGVIFEDEKGKVGKNLPSPRKSDDPVKTAAIKARFSTLKRNLKQIVKSQTERLEKALAEGRCWPSAIWRRRLIEHPITFSITRRLVFEALVVDGATAFAVTVAGELYDLAGEPFELVPEAQVRLLHPVMLDEVALAGWRSDRQHRGLTEPFPQLHREAFKVVDVPEKVQALLAELNKAPTTAFARNLSHFGFEPGPRQDAGLVNDSSRAYGEFRVVLYHDGYTPGYFDYPDAMEITGVQAWKGNDEVPWRELPPQIFSEVVRAMYKITLTMA